MNIERVGTGLMATALVAFAVSFSLPAQAQLTMNAMTMNAMTFNAMSVNGRSLNSMTANGRYLNSMTYNGAALSGSEELSGWVVLDIELPKQSAD